MREGTGKNLSLKLKRVLPEYRSISEAPDGIPDEMIRDERTRRYKAIDDDGHVFLVMNPAAWPEHTDAKGRTWRHRPKPQPMGHISRLSTHPVAASKEREYEDLML